MRPTMRGDSQFYTAVGQWPGLTFRVGITFDQMRPASVALRGFEAPVNQATHSKRCTGQGIEVDSMPSGAFALLYFAGRGCRTTLSNCG